MAIMDSGIEIRTRRLMASTNKAIKEIEAKKLRGQPQIVRKFLEDSVVSLGSLYLLCEILLRDGITKNSSQMLEERMIDFIDRHFGSQVQRPPFQTWIDRHNLRPAYEEVRSSLSALLDAVDAFPEVLGWTAPNGIAMCQGDVVVGLT